MEKHFNKNLIMSEEEEQFQSSNTCWISEKLIDDDDEKVRDHCHVTGKFIGVAHWSCQPQKLVKSLLDDDFRYLAQEFGTKNFLKQKDAYHYEYMDSF